MRVALVILGYGSFALAAYTGPLLVKEVSPNRSLPKEAQVQTRCEIYADKIVTLKWVNGNKVEETRAAKLTAPKLETFVKEAVSGEAEGKITRGPRTPNSPQTSYIVVEVLADDTPKWVNVRTQGSSNDEISVPGAKSLANLIETVCP